MLMFVIGMDWFFAVYLKVKSCVYFI